MLRAVTPTISSVTHGSSTEPTFDGAHFRAVLGHFPTGVTVVTGMATSTDGVAVPTGLTIGSFTSISLDPPLVGFFPQVTSDSWAAMAPSGAFCVNVLRVDDQELCWRFARNDPDDPIGLRRFDGVTWHASPAGSPIIEDVGAWIDCTVLDVIELGDHLLVVGAVVALDHHHVVPEPLVFYRGAVGRFTGDG